MAVWFPEPGISNVLVICIRSSRSSTDPRIDDRHGIELSGFEHLDLDPHFMGGVFDFLGVVAVRQHGVESAQAAY